MGGEGAASSGAGHPTGAPFPIAAAGAAGCPPRLPVEGSRGTEGLCQWVKLRENAVRAADPYSAAASKFRGSRLLAWRLALEAGVAGVWIGQPRGAT